MEGLAGICSDEKRWTYFIGSASFNMLGGGIVPTELYGAVLILYMNENKKSFQDAARVSSYRTKVHLVRSRLVPTSAACGFPRCIAARIRASLISLMHSLVTFPLCSPEEHRQRRSSVPSVPSLVFLVEILQCHCMLLPCQQMAICCCRYAKFLLAIHIAGNLMSLFRHATSPPASTLRVSLEPLSTFSKRLF